MSTSPDYMQQLLAQVGGLLGDPGSAPPITGGLLGKLNQALSSPGPVGQLGMALMANNSGGSSLGSVLGQSMQKAQQANLQSQAAQIQNLQGKIGLAQGAMGLQQNQQSWPSILAAMQRLVGQQSGQSAQPDSQQTAQTTAGDNSPSGAGAGAPFIPGISQLPSGPPAMPQAQPGVIPMRAGGMGSGPGDLLNLGAVMSLAGRPGAQNLVDVAKTQMQYDPATQAQLEYWKSQIGQDQYALVAARQNDNPQAIQAANIKLLKDQGMFTVASQSGDVTTFGGLSPASLGMTNLNPSKGTVTVNGVQAPLPGAVDTQRALAGANAQGEAQGQLQELTDTTGSITGQRGATYYVPRSTLLGGTNPSIPMRAPAANIGAGQGPFAAVGAIAPGQRGGPPVADLGPRQKTYLSDSGKSADAYLSDLQKNADAAVNTNYSIDQMLQAAQGAQIGPAAPYRQAFEKWAGAIGGMFGIPPPKELTSYQEVQKYANKVAFDATTRMGSREAAQIVRLQMESNPNASLTQQAFIDLNHGMKAMNNYVFAKNSTLASQTEANGGDYRTASAWWDQNIDPKAWDVTLSTGMASKWAPVLGPQKLATAMQFMKPEDQLSVLANVPRGMRPSILAMLPPELKKGILNAGQ